MKHEKLARRLFAELHEFWMDDQDKAEFDAEMMRLFGAQLDIDIEAGIANGFTDEQQENMARSLLRAMKE